MPHEHSAILVADNYKIEKITPLTDGLQLSIFPPLAGGV
jgi:molybdopterin converting factor small subunit